jgi:hypothetical protein
MNLSLIIIGGFVLFVFVIIIAIVALTSRGKQFANEHSGGEDMIRKIYIYIVLLTTLMMTIGGSIAAFMAIADIISPPAYYQSFTDYQRMPSAQNQAPLTQEELKENYKQMVSEYNQTTNARAVNSLIKSFGWVIIPLPVFLYFQRKLKRSNNQ